MSNNVLEKRDNDMIYISIMFDYYLFTNCLSILHKVLQFKFIKMTLYLF